MEVRAWFGSGRQRRGRQGRWELWRVCSVHDDVPRWPWSCLQLFPLQDFLCQIERYCRQCHLTTPITFPPEHPVEEVGRLLLCCLLKHEDLGTKLDVPALWRPLPDAVHALTLLLAKRLLQVTWHCPWLMPAR